MKNLFLFALFLCPALTYAEASKALHCQVSSIAPQPNGTRITTVLSDTIKTENFEIFPIVGAYASIMGKTEDKVDYSATITGNTLSVSLGYGKQQTSFGGSISEDKPFKLSLFFRSGNIPLRGTEISSLNLECKIKSN